ncbi:hypothetical protein HF086_014650 [Spodoptera exigua]|uniref:Uncharacterized protein n=1 Tax=Spodoptera exigua TaxID=7107 RepID=A0A922M6R6_SPOEX|nr:hypothetical protein HF086_014650 [Spodoptera exigua]
MGLQWSCSTRGLESNYRTFCLPCPHQILLDTESGDLQLPSVISISLRSKFPPSEQNSEESLKNEMDYCKILNRLLPKDIKAVAWMPIPENLPEFSARFDCKKRLYKYYFPRSMLDIRAMKEACSYLKGSNDYRNLCKMDVGNGVVEFIREILSADIFAVNPDDLESHPVHHGRSTPHRPGKPQYNMALDLPLNLFHCSYDITETQDWRYSKQELAEVLGHLQSEWTLHSINKCESETQDTDSQQREKDRVIAYADCLIQGVKAKVYKPLLKRDTCSSLEERIEHYKKKRKLADPNEEAEGKMDV